MKFPKSINPTTVIGGLILFGSTVIFSGLANNWSFSRKIKNGEFSTLTWTDLTSK